MSEKYTHKVIRDSAILTTSYVATVIRWEDDNLDLTTSNQSIILVDFTIWSLTSMEMKFESSNDWINFYQETSLDISSTTWTVNLFEYSFTGTWKYRIAIPLKDKFIRLSVKGTGTVTSSLCKLELVTGVA